MTGVQAQAAKLLEQIKEMSFVAARRSGYHLDIGKVEVIQMALEKQVPMKIRDDEYEGYDGGMDWLCPRCHKLYRTEWKVQYCPDCGQAIDWRDK